MAGTKWKMLKAFRENRRNEITKASEFSIGNIGSQKTINHTLNILRENELTYSIICHEIYQSSVKQNKIFSAMKSINQV